VAFGPGAVTVRVDGGPTSTFNLQPEAAHLPIAQNLRDARHVVEIAASGPVAIDGFIVRRAPNTAPGLAAVMAGVLIVAWLSLTRQPRTADERR
jgi:hypothetical protein